MKSRIKTKLWLGMGFLITVILAIGLIGSYYLYKTSKAAEQIIQDNYESIVYTEEMTVRLDGLQRDVTSGILPGNNRAAAFLEDFDKRSEEHTSELQSLMRISYAVFCLKNKKQIKK